MSEYEICADEEEAITMCGNQLVAQMVRHVRTRICGALLPNLCPPACRGPGRFVLHADPNIVDRTPVESVRIGSHELLVDPATADLLANASLQFCFDVLPVGESMGYVALVALPAGCSLGAPCDPQLDARAPTTEIIQACAMWNATRIAPDETEADRRWKTRINLRRWRQNRGDRGSWPGEGLPVVDTPITFDPALVAAVQKAAQVL